MKILHVIDQIGEQYGGSAMAARKLTKALKDRGHDITIYTSDAGVDGTPDLVNAHIYKTLFTYQESIRITPSMMLAKFSDFDIIHCHNYYTFQNFIALTKDWTTFGTPIVLQPHGCFVLYDGLVKELTPGHKLIDIPWRWWVRHNISKVVCVSGIEVDQAKKLGLLKTIKIPNGIDMSEYGKLPAPGKFREKHGIPYSDKVVLFVGRNHKLKGLDILYRAFNNFKDKSNLRLVIIGATENEQSEDHIFWKPAIYGTEKLEAYVDADLLVVPSRYDIFGIVALEGLACGLPVIVSENCGIRDYIDSPLILTCKYFEDLEYLVSAILKSDTKEKDRDRRISAARILDWTFIASVFEGVYNELVR